MLPASAETLSTVQPPAPPPAARLRLTVQDTLACGQRLWMRGRLEGCSSAPISSVSPPRWWNRWGRISSPRPAPAAVHFETRVGKLLLSHEPSLERDGHFDALLTARLPVARRGWRVARHRARVGEQSVEACSLVLEPTGESEEAVVIVLPMGSTRAHGRSRSLIESRSLADLAEPLRELAAGPSGARPVYCLACVGADASQGQAGVALVLTALRWPASTVIALPTRPEDARDRLLQAFAHLRWLLAERFRLVVVNREAALSRGDLEGPPNPLRAPVARYAGPQDDPWIVAGRQPFAPSPVLAATPRPARSARIPRHPVVFCHGMLAFSMLRMRLPEDLNCFAPLREYLHQRGIRALLPQVPPTSGVAERAARLREQIGAAIDGPVNIVAHSMGGLDARYMISRLGMANRVRSLTTVSTPHLGTYLADWFIANFRHRVPLLLALEALGVNVDGFRDCRPSVCRAFNAAAPNVPGVAYFSYGGEVQPARLSPVLRRAWSLLTPVEGPNDGMVSRASATWGEYLGTVPADHFAQTPDGVFVRPGEDFDSLGFFTSVLEELARRGF